MLTSGVEAPCAEYDITGSEDENGSIAPYIIFLFTILMFLIFSVSNVAAMYIAKRDLTNRVEEQLVLSAQELDEFRYYYGSPLTDFLAERAIESGKLRVPVDCGSARDRFVSGMAFGSGLKLQDIGQTILQDVRRTIEEERRSSGLQLISFDCDGFEIRAIVEENFPLPFQLRFIGISHFRIRVEAATASRLLSI